MAGPVLIQLTGTQRFVTRTDASGVETPAIGVRIPFQTSIVDTSQTQWFKLMQENKQGQKVDAKGCKVVNISYGGAGTRCEWHVLITTDSMEGQRFVRIDWQGPEDPVSKTRTDYRSDVPIRAGSTVNAQTTIDLRPNTPVLSTMLVGPLLGKEAERMAAGTSLPADPDGRAAAVVTILQHVHDGLRRGLGELWAAAALSATKQGVAYCDWDVDGFPETAPAVAGKPTRASDELMEAWAQAITEHVSPTVYQGAAGMLGSWRSPTTPPSGVEHQADAGFLVSIRKHLEATGELCVPLMFECQQLTAWVLFTSGLFTLSTYPIPGHIAPIDGTTQVQIGSAVTVKALKDNAALKPATCIFKQTTGTAHVGPLLRVPGDESLQMLDTGAWQAHPPGTSGNHDTLVRTRLAPPTEGVIVPNDPYPDPTQLKTFIKRLRAARPLAVAQLAIYIRGQENASGLLWASGFVPLHEPLDPMPPRPNSTPTTPAASPIPDPPNQTGYPISRLMASLRGCPFANAVSVHWYVWAPVDTAGTKTEKTNNLAYVIRHGNWRTPDSGEQQFWWQEPNGGPNPGSSPLASAELAPYGQRPIPRVHVVRVRLQADGRPTVAGGMNSWQSNLDPHPGFLASFRNHVPQNPPPAGFLRCVNLTSNVADVPDYFGGNRAPSVTAPTTTGASDPPDWVGSDSWEESS